MSRSVSIPLNAFKLAYASIPDDEFDFEYALDCFRDAAATRYPSLRECDTWIGREDRAVLENPYCYIVVSEYNGIVTLSVVVKNGNKASYNWAERFDTDALVDYFGDRLISKGCFISNGEQVFIRASAPREHISSNGSRW